MKKTFLTCLSKLTDKRYVVIFFLFFILVLLVFSFFLFFPYDHEIANFHFKKGHYYFNTRKDYVMALDEYKLALRYELNDSYLWYPLATTYRQLNNFSLAEKYAKKALGKDENNPNIMYLLANILLDMEKVEEAKSIINMIEIIDPGYKNMENLLKRLELVNE